MCVCMAAQLQVFRSLLAARNDGASPVSVDAAKMEDWMLASAVSVRPGDSVLPQDLLEGNKTRLFLGQGGFGTVYKGQFRCPYERKVIAMAIKKTSSLLALPEAEAKEQHLSLLDCLRREVRVLSNLQHPHIIKLFAFSQPTALPLEGGFPCIYLAYELCGGGSLADALRDDAAAAQLSWEKRLAIVLGIAHALVYLHSPSSGHAVIFHRDVKPQNIALTTGAWPVAKLIDCGLARYIPAHDSKLSYHTKTGQVFGTPGYQCPEYVSEPSDYDATSEVFSFGVLLAEVFTGRLQNQKVEGKRTKLKTKTMKTLPCDGRAAAWPVEAMQEWRQLAQDCLEADREDRVQDMVQVLARLEQVCRARHCALSLLSLFLCLSGVLSPCLTLAAHSLRSFFLYE